MKPILVIDNYDSFVYNLVHYLQEFDAETEVVRNDEIGKDLDKKYAAVLFSPGPGLPSEAGDMLSTIQQYAGKIPMLGVCLGHQAIAEVYGGKLINLKEVFHGVATKIKVDSRQNLFKDLPEEFEVGRYHSWVVDKPSLPDCFSITAEDESGMIMAMKHKKLNIYGVQFHPESVLTEHGKKMIKNWLEDIKKAKQSEADLL